MHIAPMVHVCVSSFGLVIHCRGGGTHPKTHSSYGWVKVACRHLHVNNRVARTQVGDGVFEVLSTSGDTHLGGDDFDKRIVDFLADEFQRNEGMDLRKDRQALQRCVRVCVCMCKVPTMIL